MSDRLKIGQEVLIHGYVDEIRKDTIIIQNKGGYFGTVECEVTDNETPSTNEVLDKIRAEIQGLRNCSCSCSDGIIDDVEDIIDKYKAEGIDKE